MPALRRPRSEAFAQAIVKGMKTGKNITECYIAAGFNTDGASARACASRLLTSASVQDRIAEIMQPAVKKSRVTVESLIAQFDQVFDNASADKQHGAANAAAANKAKLVGHLRDRLEIGHVGAFDGCESREEIAARMLEDEPDLDELLAGMDGLRAAVIEAASNRAKLIAPEVQNRGQVRKSLR